MCRKFQHLFCLSFFVSAIFIILFSASVVASETATISGYVYDFSFEYVENTIVKISTVPVQVMVAKDGYYSFDVPLGNYTLYSRKDDLISADEIVVLGPGIFRYDIILLPEFDETDWIIDTLDDLGDNLNLKEFDVEVVIQRREYILYIMLAILAIIINFIIVMHKKTRKKIFTIFKFFKVENGKKSQHFDLNVLSSDKYSEMVLKFLEEQNGRATQKEIRKNIPLSEAKISLLLTELEEEGRIKKFKSGRSNIVILKKA